MNKLRGCNEKYGIHLLRAPLTVMVVVLPDPFRGMGARRKSTETQHRNRPRPKVWTRGQKWKRQRLAASRWWCSPHSYFE